MRQSGSSVRTRTISAVQPDGPGAEPLTIWQIILTKPSSASTVTYNLPKNTNSVQNTQNTQENTQNIQNTQITSLLIVHDHDTHQEHWHSLLRQLRHYHVRGTEQAIA